MTFIGFTANIEDETNFGKSLKEYLRKIGIKAIVVAINEKSINNIKNIHFETIIVDRNLKGLKEILKTARYLILNADSVNTEQFQSMNLTVITYGFGNKSTITASSVDEEKMLLCLQRGINNIQNKAVEPQEISIKKNENEKNEYLYMIIGSIMLLYN